MDGSRSAALAIEGLSVRFGTVVAVDEVSFAVARGEMVAVIGPSGAGKSTLLRAVNRLAPVSAGRIVADGVDVSRLGGRALYRWRARAAMVFQQFNLSPRLDALTNVLAGRLIALPFWRSWTGLFPHADQLEAMALLDEFGLADKAFVRVERLSGGQQQRVAIARALMQRPEIILADEPTASLDPRNAALVMETLRAINRARGITTLVNLHNVGFARDYADRIVALRAGRVVFEGPPAALDRAMLDDLYSGDETETDAVPVPFLEPA
jgi:phosphonate transport system ATP-binding protein